MGRAAAVVALVAHTEFAFLLVLSVPTFFLWRAVFGENAVAVVVRFGIATSANHAGDRRED